MDAIVCTTWPAGLGAANPSIFARRAIVFARYRLGHGKRCVNRVRVCPSVSVCCCILAKRGDFPTFGVHISGVNFKKPVQVG